MPTCLRQVQCRSMLERSTKVVQISRASITDGWAQIGSAGVVVVG